MEFEEKSKLNRGQTEKSLLQHCEVFLNTANHCLIAITTFYLTWYSFKVGFVEYQTYHAWFTTIGYQLFMSEGILALYNRNTYTMMIGSRTIKIRIHYILLIIGGGFALFGIPYQIYQREINNRRHFHNTHSISGLVSGIFLVLALLSGCSALFSTEIRRFIRPLISKSTHNLLASLCYMSGMFSTISAYYTRSWLVKADPGEVRYIMMWCLSFIMAITMIGPLKSARRYFV